jgi:hypothetical protein
MDYRQWLHIIVLFFWSTTILACILALLRGRIFVISSIYFILFVTLFGLMGILGPIVAISGADEIINSLFALLLIPIAATFIIGVYTERNHYYFWGAIERTFLEAVHSVLQKNNLEYKEEGKNKLLLLKYPNDIYQYYYGTSISAGITLIIINTKKGKIDQGKLLPKIKNALSGESMNLSGKIFLIIIILFSFFMSYVYSLVMG